MSIAFSGAATGSIFARIVSTAPLISSTVSPRTRSAIRNPPIWLGVASPDMMISKASRASAKLSAVPAATLAIWVLRSGMASEVQRLLHRGPVHGHLMLGLKPCDKLVEQIVFDALGNAFDNLVRQAFGGSRSRLEHLGDLEEILPLAGRVGEDSHAALRLGKDGLHARSPDIRVVRLPLDAALDELFLADLGRDLIQRFSVFQFLFQLLGARAEPRDGLRFCPVGKHLVVDLLEGALARGDHLADLVEQEA